MVIENNKQEERTSNNNQIPKPEKNHKPYYRYWIWAALLLIILFTSIVRVRLLAIPLERDEGEYAYAGQLILQGVAPYSQAYNMKMPGIYFTYAVIMAIFGQTHTGIHMGLLVVNVATIVLLFILGKKLFGPGAGVVTAAVFALLSLVRGVFGTAANAEHFVILPAIGGILLLTRTIDSENWLSLLASALLLGLAFIMKQHGAVFIVFGGLYLFFCELRRRPFNRKVFAGRNILFSIGALLPFIVTCLVLWQLGTFQKFWFWTFEYAREYVTMVSLSQGLINFKDNVVNVFGATILLLILAGIGLISVFWNIKKRQHSVFILGLLLLSFLAVCPGLYFRNHYFILFFPAVSLLAGIGAESIHAFYMRGKSIFGAKGTSILIVMAILCLTILQHYNLFFVANPMKAARMTYGYNPFPESLEIARCLRENSEKDDHIVVLGSEPQIYFYSNRRSATGYIYMYGLMEEHDYALKMQNDMIQEVESKQPEFLVLVKVPTSWWKKKESIELIFEWFEEYKNKHYQLVGSVEVGLQPESTCCWDEEGLCEPQTPFWIGVFQLRS